MGSYFWVLKFLSQNQGVPVYIVQNAMDDHSLTLFSPKSIKYYRNQISTTVKVYIYTLDDELKKFLQFLLTNDKFKPPNHKKLICFTLVCLWNVQIQILNQPKRPS